MKKTLLATATIILSGTAFAQTGNVGIGTGTPGSKLTVNGSFGATYNIITATSYALLATDYYLAYNGASNGTVTLPTGVSGAGNFKGRVYNIKNTTTASTLTVQAPGTELLDNQSGAGVASVVLPAGYFATFISKGTTGAVTTWEVAFIGNSTGSSVSADNGLTVGYNSPGNVGLGGTLGKATDIATGSNNLTFSGTGNVGIGQATAPAAKLEITPGAVDPLKLNGLQNIGAAAFNSLVVTSTGVVKQASSATQTYANTETATQTFSGAQVTAFNNGTPQVLTFTAGGGVINSGGIITFNSGTSSFTVVSAGIYSLEGFANFMGGALVTPSFNLIGVNFAFTKNGTAVGNVVSGTRYNITNAQSTNANNGLFTKTTVALAAGDVIYLVMYKGALDDASSVVVAAPIGLGESKRVTIAKL